MGSSLLITLREGLEAALIIGIILAFLMKAGHREQIRGVWIGVGLAVVTSMVAGAAIFFIAGEFSGRNEEIFEGFAMLLAAGVITWMVFWMKRESIHLRTTLQEKISTALVRGSALGIVSLSFFVVVREGVETAFFLFSANQVSDSPVQFLIGGVIGLVLAVAIGYGIYRGSIRFSLKAFFTVTSVILMFFAAGLLAHGVHEFQEAGVIPFVIEHIWDMNHIIPEKSTFGEFLSAVSGYNGNPSLLEVSVYCIYLVTVLVLYFLPKRKLTELGPLEASRSSNV